MSSSNIINSVHSVHVTSLECDSKRVLVKISWDTHNNTVKIMRVSRSKTATQAMTRGDNGAGDVREGVGRRVLGGGGAGICAIFAQYLQQLESFLQPSFPWNVIVKFKKLPIPLRLFRPTLHVIILFILLCILLYTCTQQLT